VLVNFGDIGGDTGAHVKKSCMGLGFRRRGRLLRGWFLAAATVPAAMLIKNRFHHMAAQ
jgi:hypothetical protein